MKPAVHCKDFFLSERAENQLAGMAFDGRNRKVWNILVLPLALYVDFRRQASQTAAKNYGGFNSCANFAGKEISGFLDIVVHNREFYR